MKLSETAQDLPNLITAYSPGLVRIGQQAYDHSLMLAAHLPPQPWPVENGQDLTLDHLELLLQSEPELILIGTGKTQIFPPPALLAPLMAKRIGYEIMATDAACRTWNILLAEGRRVVAGLVV